MITASKFHPSVPGVHELQKNGQYVGFHQGSYIEGLLVEIGFDTSKLRAYATLEYFYSALSNGSIVAVVLDVPYIKLFLAKYNKGYSGVAVAYLQERILCICEFKYTDYSLEKFATEACKC